MLAVKHEFPWMFEYLVGNTHHTHLRISRSLLQIGANRIDRIANENRFDETQLVVAIAEGMDAVMRHQAKPQTKNHRAGNKPPPEHAFFGGKYSVCDIRV